MPESSLTQVQIQDRLAVVWLDRPGEKVNTISSSFLAEFEELLDRLEGDREIIGAVFISRKKDNFIAGADLEEFRQMHDSPGQAYELSRNGNRLLSRMANSAKPLVAAIHGAAVGGGLELALACHYRIASDSPKTVLGQPEVKLGLLPAAGGTQRLPRLIGLQKALGLLLTGRNVDPGQARKLGLVDELIHPHGLLEAARSTALQLSRQPRPARRVRLSLGERILETTSLGRRLIYRQAEKRIRRESGGHYPAPFRILECVRTGLEKGLEAGLQAEARGFEELMQSPQARSLIYLFFSMKAARKNPQPEKARPIEHIGVLGAGLMGSGIAQVSAEKGLWVSLRDISQQALAAGEKRIHQELERKVRKKALSPFERDQVLGRILAATDFRSLSRAGLVIEAVFEDLELKQKVIREVEELTTEATVIASNTSSIPISRIAAACARPAQIIGMHYFSPVPKMPLLEIIRTPQNSDRVVSTAVETGIRQGKHVIVVSDAPGFYTTRILAPLLNEALLLLKEGARIEEIDRAMKAFGFPIGPLALLDEVGIDVGAHVSRTLSPLFQQRGETPSDAAEKLDQAGFQGRKNGRGFYRYGEGKKREPNPEIYRQLNAPTKRSVPALEIQLRLSSLMINEAAFCLQEGVLSSPRDGDLGAVLGLGFPPFQGGPFRHIDSVGANAMLSRLSGLAEKLGKRFEPAPILRDYAAECRRFHSS